MKIVDFHEGRCFTSGVAIAEGSNFVARVALRAGLGGLGEYNQNGAN